MLNKLTLLALLILMSVGAAVAANASGAPKIFQGEEPVVVGQILSYTLVDIIMTSVSAIVLGISGFPSSFLTSLKPVELYRLLRERQSLM